MSESVPLLTRSLSYKRRCSSCPFPYHFQFIHSKGAILVLFWDLMIANSMNLIMNYIASHSNFVEIGSLVMAALSLVMIFTGFLGDFLISRYKLVLIGSYILFVLLIPLMMLEVLHPVPYPVIILITLLMIIFVVVRVNLLPFNIDQLIGSSSDELTAVIHWHNIGPIIAIMASPAMALINNDSIICIISIAICILSVTAVLVSHNLFNHYLETTPVNTSNPIKLIVRVLCYARKHKYPENRSALTYWEEEAPSRLDLGKGKYGGPFTEEEVEDVKTILRLIPLLLVCVLAPTFYADYIQGVNSDYYGCKEPLQGYVTFIALYLFIILLHQFLIYPCFHNYIPSMLKRMGVGMTLMFGINVTFTILAVIGNYHIGQPFHCLTAFDEKSFAVKHKWTIFDGLILAVVWYINNVVLVEFLLAQCPKSMRGTIIGLWFCFRNIRHFINYVLFLPFRHYIHPEFSLGRGFYFCLTEAIISLIMLLIFVLLARKYKLRVREVEINVHQIAEDHIIRNIEEEEEYKRREMNQPIN